MYYLVQALSIVLFVDCMNFFFLNQNSFFSFVLAKLFARMHEYFEFF